MKCKFCGAEWEAEGFFCPKCGQNNAEEPVEEVLEEATVEDTVAPVEAEEAVVAEVKPSRKGLKIALAVAAFAVLLAAVAAIWYNINGGWKPKENNIHYKDSYTVTDEQAAKTADKVVATFAGEELTNGELQVYYWMQFYDFLDYFGSYLGYYIDMDYTKPLDEQMFEDSGDTWQQYFLTIALDAWKRDVTMNQLAKEAGYVLSEDFKTMLDALEADTLETATANGYTTADELVQADFGAGADFQNYADYMNRYYYGNEWYMNWMSAREPSMEDVEAYFDANASDFEASGITKDSAPVVDVRHILIMPEGDGTTDDEGYPVYTEEAWDAARLEAFAVYNQWRAGDMTEESFAELAKTASDDGSASVGGLYEDVTEGQMVENFEEWIMKSNRRPGDHEVIQTQFGYHIMYFVEGTPAWYYYGLEQYLYDEGNAMLEDKMAQSELEVDYRKIDLTEMDF